MQLGPSELILNADGSIYHLNLRPEDLADTIITVGDPDRVTDVSRHFDTIEVKKGKREFLTHTGTLQGKRLTVISTGIGTDNVDIVLNELDALVNIDFQSRSLKEQVKTLDIIRIGTSGAVQAEIPVDSFIMSDFAVGLDGLLHYYDSPDIFHQDMGKALMTHCDWSEEKPYPYVVEYDKTLGAKLYSNRIRFGITLTNSGFYGPQSRILRLQPSDAALHHKITSFTYEGRKITNLEMETSGIYGLSKLLGHRAVSMNCVLANRASGDFSKDPRQAVESLIQYTLSRISKNR